MLTVLAKLGSPEMVGQFALGLALTAPVFMFCNLQLRAVQATDAKAEYPFGDYLSLRIFTTIIALVVIEGIIFFSHYSRQTALVIFIIGISKAIESISDLYYGFLQQHERMDRIAQSMMIKGPLSLITLGIIVWLTRSVFWGSVGLAIAWGIILVAYDMRSGSLIAKINGQEAELNPRWNALALIKLTELALPLGFVMLLISLNTNIPRYFIEHYWGAHELGIFAAMSYVMIAGTTVISALGQSASPRLAKFYAQGDSAAFRALLIKLVGIGAALGGIGVLGALLGGREILTLLYKAEYARQDVFLIITLATGVSYISSFLGYAVTAARYFRIQTPQSALVVGATALGSFWLIPNNGLQGAALALLISSLVAIIGKFVIFAFLLRRINKNAQ